MEKPPDVVTPIRMDATKAVEQLRELGTEGRKGGQQAGEGLDKASQSAKGLGGELAGLIKVQMGLSLVKEVGGAIANQFRETSQYVQQMAKEFQGLRKSMQEVATLKGQPNTTELTLEEARKAQAFHLTPQEYRDFQAEFQNYAGSQIGGPEGKLTEKQGEEYAGRVAELMKGSGVAPSIGAELAGSLLEYSKGPQDVEALMKRFGTVFTTLEKGRVPLARALPQLTEIMGMGVSAEEAAQMFSIASPAAQGQEGTAVQAALRAVQEMKTKGTGEEFGVKRGMTAFESVKAFAENVNERKQKMMAEGMTEQKAEDELQALLAERKVASDIREARGLVGGFARQGVQFGGFERFGRIARETPEDFEAQRKARYEASKQGRQDAIEAGMAVEKAALGARNEELVKRRQIAETELMKEGRFEHATLGDRAAALVPGAENMRTQQINRQMIARARAELGEGPGLRDQAISMNEGLTDELMRDLTKRIEEKHAAGTAAETAQARMPAPAGERAPGAPDMNQTVSDPAKLAELLAKIEENTRKAAEPLLKATGTSDGPPPPLPGPNAHQLAGGGRP
jgi:hypothetical protein